MLTDELHVLFQTSFFKLKKLQVKQIQDKVSLAMRKCQTEGKKVTVGNVLNPGDFDNIVRLNEGY